MSELANNLVPPETLVDIASAKGFLGREFLTWLWYAAESQTETLSFDVDGLVVETRIWVDDRMVLESSNLGVHTIKGGRPGQSAEAAVALQSGKVVSELRFGLDIAGWGAFTATVDHRDLNPRSLKLPIDDPDQVLSLGADESTLERRLKLTQVFFTVFDELFRHYLELRLNDTWEEKEHEALKTWIRNLYQENASLYH